MNCPWIVSVQKTVPCVQLEMSRSRMEGEQFSTEMIHIAVNLGMMGLCSEIACLLSKMRGER